MDAGAGMTFRDPSLLPLLLAVPVLALFLVMRERRRAALADRLVAAALRGGRDRVRALRPWLLSIAAALLLLALAGPRFGFEEREIASDTTNLAILLDISNSMGAPDAGTTRLSAAKAIAKELLERSNGKVALVAFEGKASVIAPLTDDTVAVAELLDTLGTGELADPGTDFGAAIEQGLQLLARAGDQRGRIVIVSDGEDQGDRTDDAVRKAKDAGIVISTVGVGSAAGSEIPTEAGPLVDREGQVVRTSLDAALLASVASRTGGVSLVNPSDPRSLDSLAMSLQLSGTTHTEDVRVPVERYQWPLGAALVLVALASIAHRGAE